jgi:hypothetical protein
MHRPAASASYPLPNSACSTPADARGGEGEVEADELERVIVGFGLRAAGGGG